MAQSAGEIRRLSPRLIVALDAARAITAGYVAVHHAANSRWSEHGLGVLLRFGQEAVLVFFLLSGFVIFANERTRALHPRGYYLRRIRRIYPPLIVAMIVSTLVALDNHELPANFDPLPALQTLLGLQDLSQLKPGVIADPYLANDPLWSLSYEMMFYLIFPLVLRAWVGRPRAANHVVGAACCLLYVSFAVLPNHFSLVGSYFLVWWAGAMAADSYMAGGRDFRSMSTTLVWLLLLCVVAAGVLAVVGFRGSGRYPALPLRHFAVALSLLVLLYGPLGRWLAQACAPLGPLAVGAASLSYGVYVLHRPILVQWHRAAGTRGLLLAFAVLIVAAYLTERQLPRWLPSAPKD